MNLRIQSLPEKQQQKETAPCRQPSGFVVRQ
jgi:hypothetical protein